MPCYHPLVAFKHKRNLTKTGKAVIKFPGYFNLTSEQRRGIQGDEYTKADWERLEIPCGQCLGCAIEHSKDWRRRIILETQTSEHNYFVTLTYGEELPMAEKDGMLYPSLYKEDMTLFKKRLREHFRERGHTKIRFFECGEYGEENKRPHYHIIFFNLPLYDLEPFFINKHGQQVYRSKLLEEKWGKGIVSVGTVTYESRRYVRRYTLKKQNWKDKPEVRLPEYINMSRRPGIGMTRYQESKYDIYENDKILLKKALSDAVYQKPPKYFDKLFEEEEEEQMKVIKARRRENAIASRELKMTKTSLSYDEQLELEELELAKKIATLKREMVNN